MAARALGVHETNPNGEHSDGSGRTSDELRPSRIANLDDADGRRAWAAGLLREAIGASELSQRSVAVHMGIGETHLRRLLAGEATIQLGDLRRIPARVALPLLMQLVAEVHDRTRGGSRRDLLDLAVMGLDAVQAALRSTIRGESPKTAWMQVIGVAYEAIAGEGS